MNEGLITLLYFIAGAAGTFGRVWLSPEMDLGLNKRAVVEVVSGGVAGFVLPWFGTILAGVSGLSPETMAAMPPWIKAGIVFLLAGSGSLVVGDVLTRIRGGK